jgi:hypothetical protein
MAKGPSSWIATDADFELQQSSARGFRPRLCDVYLAI